MSLARSEVLTGITKEFADFEELIRSIDATAWASASRCAGWSVGDVCRHVTGGLAAIAAGKFEDLVGPDATARQVAARRDKSQEAVADELHEAAKVAGDLMTAVDDAAWAGPPPLDIPGTMGDAVETMWYDTYLHGDDVLTALGRPSRRGGGLRASVSHIALTLTSNGWGPATLALDGIEPFTVGGGGPAVTGDPLTFVLVATGRADPAQLGLDAKVNIYA
ncbi:MAG: maleylpyruvate isomerase family mycothiol-dependent enzyme [Acidimicrobiales bacterium]